MSHDHDCHIPGCTTKPTRANRTFCRRHWYALPEDLRARVRWAVDDDDGDGGMELAAALEAAVEHIEG